MPFPSSPRAWGCFCPALYKARHDGVFPTCVGVFPPRHKASRLLFCLPHVRGGVSQFARRLIAVLMSSPRAWGCFRSRFPPASPIYVFPTCVGVFLRVTLPRRWAVSLPHVRGGVSRTPACHPEAPASSPRAWGCFCLWLSPRTWEAVFPTCVGVFPTVPHPAVAVGSLPHVRGGVSFLMSSGSLRISSSPRAWGCFCTGAHPYAVGAVFPTCVGVFPSPPSTRPWSPSLPHVRGGVSQFRKIAGFAVESSPRAWGCFLKVVPNTALLGVFPTCVGVFPRGRLPCSARICLPHVRGGVSHRRQDLHGGGQSSPRAWGCFLSVLSPEPRKRVFPTCVGVFLLDRVEKSK